MRQPAPLAVVYALVAALVLPAAPFAAGDPGGEDPARAGAPAEPQPAGPAPADPPGGGEGAAAEPQPAPAGPQPATPAAPAGQQPAVTRAGDAATAPPTARAAAPGSVIIRDFSFAPGSMSVNVGDTVTWRNTGSEPHSATARDGSFDTGTFAGGQSRSHRFTTAGTFAYICTPHPFMKGTVRVTAAGSGGGGAGGSEGGGPGSGGGSVGAGSGEAGAGGAAGGGATTGSASGSNAAGGAGAGGSGAALPKSGADAEAVALLGGLLLALGAAVRRRASAPCGRA